MSRNPLTTIYLKMGHWSPTTIPFSYSQTWAPFIAFTDEGSKPLFGKFMPDANLELLCFRCFRVDSFCRRV